MVGALLIAAAAAAAPVAADHEQAAARAVVQRYYAAIDRRDYRTAYAQWGNRGRASGKSYAGFARGFANTAGSCVALGRAGRVEGAAGSLYVTLPVDVRARLRDGRRQHFRGTYTLRRVNGVPGASPASLRWHIASAQLRAVG